MTTLPSSQTHMTSALPNPTNPVNVPATSYDAKNAAIETARLLSDDRCSDVTLLDVRGISSVQDFVILASGTSDRQMRSAAADVKNLLPKLGSSVYRTSVDDQGTWIVVDCVDTVIHIFEPNTRAYYDLESMWGDAPKIEWLREGQKPFTPDDAYAETGDTDEPAAPAATEASEPDADIELTTGSAESFVEEVRASVSQPAAPKTKKTKAAPKSKPAVSKKKAAAPAKAKKAAKPAAKPAAKKVAKKPAPKKAVAKKAPAKAAAKKPAGKPVKKAAKAVKKAAKKKGR